jgi:hypothetical protein
MEQGKSQSKQFTEILLTLGENILVLKKEKNNIHYKLQSFCKYYFSTFALTFLVILQTTFVAWIFYLTFVITFSLNNIFL